MSDDFEKEAKEILETEDDKSEARLEELRNKTEVHSVKINEKLLQETKDDKELDIRNDIMSMELPEKLKLAMFGNSICRQLLVFDSNKMIQLAVLKNPKIQISEVEDFSVNPNCSDTLLRTIARSKDFMKSYMIKKNLCFNPKTPQDVSMKWIRHLMTHDLKRLSKSKGVPQLIANTARKILSAKTPGK